ncbi:MAG: DUF285 domain-containing protein, partial [Lachnospiraceae bacterium]|nr:DUF285 domain-containing protein [Lachnospiraceae bacterium]
NCYGLTELNLTGFNTAAVTNMATMFYNCDGLTELDLSSFDTSSVTGMRGMFWNCTYLTTIWVSTLWTTENVTNGTMMFNGCSSLVGVIYFDSSKTDYTYANYTDGYLTLKE